MLLVMDVMRRVIIVDIAPRTDGTTREKISVVGKTIDPGARKPKMWIGEWYCGKMVCM